MRLAVFLQVLLASKVLEVGVGNGEVGREH